MTDLIKQDSAYNKLIGHNLKVVRKKHYLTQPQAAVKIGVSFQQLQKYERGSNRISAAKLLLYANTLGFPIGYFFRDDLEVILSTYTIRNSVIKIEQPLGE